MQKNLEEKKPTEKCLVDLIVVAGEPSGDVHGQKLIQKLRTKNSSLKIAAVGGPHIRKEKIPILFPTEDLSTMGFFDVFWAFPRIVKKFFKLAKSILQLKPKALLLIDYPEFHLRLARYVKKRGYQGKIFQYICPSVWAWRKKRSLLMETYLDGLFTIFPFEKSFFSSSPLPAYYVGNPSLKEVLSWTPSQDFQKKFPKKTLLAIFPGSREKEILRNLPMQIRAAKKFSGQVAISVSNEKYLDLYKKILDKESANFTLVMPKDRYDLMHITDFAIATSGTVSLELALFETPTIVTFFIKTSDFLLASKVFKIDLPFYCIVNILGNTSIFPELFGPNFTQARINYLVKHWLFDQEAQTFCKTRLKQLKKILHKKDLDLADKLLLEIGV